MRPSIGTRLRELRQKRNLCLRQVAEIIGVNKSTVCSYENGSRQPAYDILVSLARFYRVSTDYLLGLTNARTIDVSGLTEKQRNVICEIVTIFADRNGEDNG